LYDEVDDHKYFYISHLPCRLISSAPSITPPSKRADPSFLFNINITPATATKLVE
jgi:hypothetical protein